MFNTNKQIFSLYILHTMFYQCYNVFNQEEDKSMVGTVAQCYTQHSINGTMCPNERRTTLSDRAVALILSMHII